MVSYHMVLDPRVEKLHGWVKRRLASFITASNIDITMSIRRGKGLGPKVNIVVKRKFLDFFIKVFTA
jgi:hypothetical protein